MWGGNKKSSQITDDKRQNTYRCRSFLVNALETSLGGNLQEISEPKPSSLSHTVHPIQLSSSTLKGYENMRSLNILKPLSLPQFGTHIGPHKDRYGLQICSQGSYLSVPREQTSSSEKIGHDCLHNLGQSYFHGFLAGSGLEVCWVIKAPYHNENK